MKGIILFCIAAIVSITMAARPPGEVQKGLNYDDVVVSQDLSCDNNVSSFLYLDQAPTLLNDEEVEISYGLNICLAKLSLEESKLTVNLKDGDYLPAESLKANISNEFTSSTNGRLNAKNSSQKYKEKGAGNAKYSHEVLYVINNIFITDRLLF